MKKVLIVHPGLQHSHQLALALYEKNMLLKYISGVPILSENEKPRWYFPSKLAKRMKKVDIPLSLREHPIFPQLLIRILRKLPLFFDKDTYFYRAFHLFDWYISRKVKLMKPDIVIGFEDSAYYVFKEAKKIGAKCILDAPSFHAKTSNFLLDTPSVGYRKKIDDRKQREIDLADLIITCSPIAADSYIENGVPAHKVKSILLGAELPNFINPVRERKNSILKFVFAGSLSKRKSVDEILEACNRLNIEGFPFTLSFVGGGSSYYIEKIKNTLNCNYVGQVSQTELYEILSNSDCLLLPSKFDSFGMVVAEAMACGTPAIVSHTTGSKVMIENCNQSGLIIDPTPDEIYLAMKFFIENEDKLFSARKYALNISKTFTWKAYRQRVSALICSL